MYRFARSEVVDTSVYINLDMNSFVQVSEQHSLIINTFKSNLILFGKPSRPTLREELATQLNVFTNGQKLELVDHVKNVGLIIDYKLDFNVHVSHLVRKAFAMLKIIYCLRKVLASKQKVYLCDVIFSVVAFNYVDTLYGPFLDYVQCHRVPMV